MKKIFIILSILSVFSLNFINSLNYITTAESISWNGAYTSVADGMEAMIYNPAGLYISEYRFGMNILGSSGARVYSNALSSDDILKILQYSEKGKNLSKTGIINKILYFMPETGGEFGFNLNTATIMIYSRLENFSFGVYSTLKTDLSVTTDKSLFVAIFDKLDLTKKVSYSAKLAVLQYIDLNFVLSTRAKFLEKVIPVEKILVGMSTHLYFPTLFAKSNAKVKLKSKETDDGFVDEYVMNVDGNITAGSNAAVTTILKQFPVMYDYAGGFLNYGGSAAFGIGFDLGFIIQFNKIVRLGLAGTDIGFIVFPHTANIHVDYSIDLDLDNVNDFKDDFIKKSKKEVSRGKNTTLGNTQWYMPSTAVRMGVAVTPFKNEIFTWATDVSVSDLNRLLNDDYPVFNISTGFEVKPGYNWFAMPLRLAVSYNTQANNPSCSCGIGLYLGPVEMEIGLKGLEFLIREYGAKEICFGYDLKYEF